MKTFLIIVCCLILLYGFIKHILPKILTFGLNIYLSCLSDEKVEAYFVKQYQKYRENPKSFSDTYVESYVGVIQISLNYWEELLEDARQERRFQSSETATAALDEEISFYQQRFDFWNNALIKVSNDNAVRKYHASLKNN